MALVVSNVSSATALLSELGEAFSVIGRIEAAPGLAPDPAPGPASLRFASQPRFGA
jgi:hypothetical protein